jgi:hypothetical protein
MTFEEAQQFARMFRQNKATVEGVEVQQGADGTYSLLVVRINGTEEIFKDAEQAGWAAAHQVGEETRQGGLFAIIGEDGVPIQCDFETWKAQGLANVEKTTIKISCSKDVEATIFFSGHSPSLVSMDGRAKFWAVSFYSVSRNEHYGWGPGVFETLDEAEACVARYIEKGCPPPGTIEWFKQ